MALAIGVRERDVVYVGDIPVRVINTEGFERAEIEVGHGSITGPSCRSRVFYITDKKATEILPGVFVSCGRPDQRFIDKHARLLKEYEEEAARRVLDPLRDAAGLAPISNPGRLLPRLIFE